jgi:hypothetical protein
VSGSISSCARRFARAASWRKWIASDISEPRNEGGSATGLSVADAINAFRRYKHHAPYLPGRRHFCFGWVELIACGQPKGSATVASPAPTPSGECPWGTPRRWRQYKRPQRVVEGAPEPPTCGQVFSRRGAEVNQPEAPNRLFPAAICSKPRNSFHWPSDMRSNLAILRSRCQSSMSAVDKLLCAFDGRAVICAVQLHVSYDVVVVINDVDLIVTRLRHPGRRNSQGLESVRLRTQKSNTNRIISCPQGRATVASPALNGGRPHEAHLQKSPSPCVNYDTQRCRESIYFGDRFPPRLGPVAKGGFFLRSVVRGPRRRS